MPPQYTWSVRWQAFARLRFGEPVAALAATLFGWQRQELIDAGVIAGTGVWMPTNPPLTSRSPSSAELALTPDVCEFFDGQAAVPPERRRANR